MIEIRRMYLGACLGLMVPSVAVAQSTGASSDSAAIAAASRAFSAAYVRNDTAALGRIYSDSAVLLPPNREIRGRAAIQRDFAGPRTTGRWRTRWSRPS